MRQMLLIMGLFMALPLAADGTDPQKARLFEEKAFKSADEKQWCQATFHFLKAHEAEPTVEYIYNAAMAADSAGDRRWAIHLFVSLIGNYPEDKRNQTINQRTQSLTREIGRFGPGEMCPNRVADSDSTTSKSAYWLKGPPLQPVPTQKPIKTIVQSNDDNIKWTMVATGGTLALGGGTMAILGASPYFEGLTLYERVLADNSSQNRQNYTLTRERWQNLGKPVAIAGSVAFVVGSLATGFGLNWALSSPQVQE